MNAVIKAENLGKKYIISHQKQRGGATLRDTMTHTARGVWQRIRHPLSPNRESIDLEELWALKDVNFEVQQGERIGIIGPNGAGKSTLLKILSHITEPTTGKVRIKGRVSSLLEVGTGFHPELTGRENVFLNGAILGMTRQEIKGKFDEIVAFAELEKFLDTPVKRYSSGMYVRLAFAVAAHLEPEILIVDEVLAVGDAAFQKKCLGKMEDVAKEGRTVLFVSHNMAVIRSLCEKGILVQNGRIISYEPVGEVVDKYLMSVSTTTDSAHTVTFPKPSNYTVWIESVSILCNGMPTTIMKMGDTLTLDVNFSSESPITDPIIGFVISSVQGENVLNVNNIYLPSKPLSTPRQKGTIRCEIGMLPLTEKHYFVSFWLGIGGYEFQHIEHALSFEVVAKDIWGTGKIPSGNVSLLWWPTEFRFL